MHEWSVAIPIVKADAEKRLATGWAVIAADADGSYVEDHQGDIIEVDDLEKAAHQALRSKATAGDMHERTGLGEIVESMVVTAEKREALGFGKGPSGWVVTMKIHDDALWADIKAGKKLELSIHGTGRRAAV